MKRSGIQRKTAMSPGKGLKQRTPSATTGVLRATASARKAPAVKSALKTKQLAVTAGEKKLWDQLAQLGCVACMKDGHFNPHVSIHHVDGRTKPGCHQRVLPLCGPHHQDDGSGAIAIHPWKARFEARYGSQAVLMAYCAALLKAAKSKASIDCESSDASITKTYLGQS